MRLVAAQLRAELRLLARNGEQLLLTLVIPVMLLVFFSLVDVLPHGDGDAVDFLTPGVVALAVMSASMVSLGIATGFERSYKVLKRLGATPLGRGRWLVAKTLAIVAVEIVQLVVLLAVAALLGWSPSDTAPVAALGAVVLGTVAFAGLGLTIAGRLRAEVNLAAQNGLYLVLLLLGGMVIPLDELPGPLETAASYLPSAALADVLRDTLGTGGVDAGSSWITLAVWAAVLPMVATRAFRWE